MSSLPSSGSRSRKLGSDSSPYRSISAGEESDSEAEDENMKPRGKHIETTITSRQYHGDMTILSICLSFCYLFMNEKKL